MSLEEQVAGLTAATQTLTATVESKVAEWDMAVQSALKSTTQAGVSFYVDAVNGDDANDGSMSSPLATIHEAVSRTVLGQACQVKLLSDYVVRDKNISVRGISLRLSGSEFLVKNGRKPRFQVSPSSDNLYANRIYLYEQTAVAFIDLEVFLPDRADGFTGSSAHICVLTGATHYYSGHSGIAIHNTDIVSSGDPAGSFLTPLYSGINLAFTNSNFIAGRLIHGVAAGADPNTLWNVRSNIISA